MEIGMIGLGRMGMNMSRRLLLKGHRVVAYNRTPAKTELLASEGADPAYSLAELAERLRPRRAVWLMLPAGATGRPIQTWSRSSSLLRLRADTSTADSPGPDIS